MTNTDIINRQLEKIWPGFRAVEILGKGSFGTVYRIVRDDRFQSALKVIDIPLNEQDIQNLYAEGADTASIRKMYSVQVQGIQNEIELMETLKSAAHIVSIEDYRIFSRNDGQIGWRIFIRMELLQNMGDYLKSRGALTEKEIIRLGLDICDALRSCQTLNIIHRDIKPANIFRSSFGDFKLGDFGISKKMEATMASTRAGTPAYEAPEIMLGRKYDKTVDIYAIGMVLYTYLNRGRKPFFPLPPDVPSFQEREAAEEKRLSGAPLPAPVDAPPDLCRIILKACDFDPRKRYQDAESLYRDLMGCHIAREGYSSGSEYNTFSKENGNIPVSSTNTDISPSDEDDYRTALLSDRSSLMVHSDKAKDSSSISGPIRSFDNRQDAMPGQSGSFNGRQDVVPGQSGSAGGPPAPKKSRFPVLLTAGLAVLFCIAGIIGFSMGSKTADQAGSPDAATHDTPAPEAAAAATHTPIPERTPTNTPTPVIAATNTPAPVIAATNTPAPESTAPDSSSEPYVPGSESRAYAEAGKSQEFVNAVSFYEFGNYRDAYNSFLALADDGDSDACYYLGFMYYSGKGVTQSYESALNWFSKSAGAENEKAEYYLGIMNYSGYGTQKSDTAAFKWFLKSAKQGYAPAQYKVGFMYYNGYGIQKNKMEAGKWFKKAAEQGNEAAQNMLMKFNQT